VISKNTLNARKATQLLGVTVKVTLVVAHRDRLTHGLRNYRRQLNEALEQDYAAGAPHPA
jgi:hypothetical protein